MPVRGFTAALLSSNAGAPKIDLTQGCLDIQTRELPKMLKSLITTLALSAVILTGYAVVAQVHHKVGHCFPPGVAVAGCVYAPQGPQLPKPPGK